MVVIVYMFVMNDCYERYMNDSQTRADEAANSRTDDILLASNIIFSEPTSDNDEG